MSWTSFWKWFLTNVVTTGRRGETSMGLICNMDLKHFLKEKRQYPLVDNVENRILVAFLKSVCWVQILWNLNNWDVISPANVCFGWKLVLNKRTCVSVCLKNTVTSSPWLFRKFGPLNVVVSKESIEFFKIMDLSLIEALWLFRVLKNTSKSCSECYHIPQISSGNR